jgi:hypothetical protein
LRRVFSDDSTAMGRSESVMGSSAQGIIGLPDLDAFPLGFVSDVQAIRGTQSTPNQCWSLPSIELALRHVTRFVAQRYNMEVGQAGMCRLDVTCFHVSRLEYGFNTCLH